jgi:hypothetical protein
MREVSNLRGRSHPGQSLNEVARHAHLSIGVASASWALPLMLRPSSAPTSVYGKYPGPATDQAASPLVPFASRSPESRSPQPPGCESVVLRTPPG